jgi:biopolymer transport protein ExbD
MKTGHKLKKPEKLNLVPILDSVFIFIFFLLMSAQFVEVYEIGSSVPMVQKVKEELNEKDPLNLTVEVSKDQIIVKTGLKQKAVKTFSMGDELKIKEYLKDLKATHPNENTITFKADPKLSFQKLVTVIDSTQANENYKGKLFEQIVFDQGELK